MVGLHGIANVSEHEVGQQLQELVLVHCVHEEVRSAHLVQRLGEHFWKVVVCGCAAPTSHAPPSAVPLAGCSGWACHCQSFNS